MHLGTWRNDDDVVIIIDDDDDDDVKATNMKLTPTRGENWLTAEGVTKSFNVERCTLWLVSLSCSGKTFSEGVGNNMEEVIWL